MQQPKTVFQFSDPIEYLQFRYEERRRRDPAFSMSAWARRLGYENPSFLFQVLKRERSLKMNLVSRLARDLGLKGRALRYFECLTLEGTAKNDAERKMYLTLARQARPRKLRALEDVSLETFNLIAEWHHVVLAEAIHLRDFREDPDHLRRLLGERVSRRAVKAALERLVEAGLLSRGADGELQRASGNAEDISIVRPSVPSEAIRAFHLQMLEFAREAVQEQSIDERYLRGSTLPIKQENYARATEIIDEAHRKLMELAAKDGGDHVYQLNSQFFRLTAKGPKSRAPKPELH